MREGYSVRSSVRSRVRVRIKSRVRIRVSVSLVLGLGSAHRDPFGQGGASLRTFLLPWPRGMVRVSDSVSVSVRVRVCVRVIV